MATSGRKTKRTPEVEKRILDALRVGATQKDAALAAGIDETTLSRWKGAFADFADSIARAEASCSVRLAARIYQEATAEKGDWKAALEFLKRRRRAEWGDSLDLRKLSDEELIERAKSLIGGVGTAGADI